MLLFYLLGIMTTLEVIRYISPNLWITDPREPDSPYASVFCHTNELADDINVEDLMNRETVVEFYLGESDQGEGLVASNVRLVYTPGR